VRAKVDFSNNLLEGGHEAPPLQLKVTARNSNRIADKIEIPIYDGCFAETKKSLLYLYLTTAKVIQQISLWLEKKALFL
jgi:hypothetical protein